ncbi:MAG TPA: protein-glutamate O-methyltransferase CheR [Thermoanaerobaculia bacterium]|nr:protein-glutamate O-methyltransferase CheR [Thermoanaerobaculia bacterium]
MSSLTSKDFRLFQSLVQKEAGIFLSDQKRALLMGRLAPRMRLLGIASFDAYYDHVMGDRDELVRMLDAICTNETHFFREPKQFEFLEQQLLPAWRANGKRHVRVWSAGCSTGEEPYSIAMSLAFHLPGAAVEILASDLSTKVLQKAAAGIWPIERAQEIPIVYRKTFMCKGRGSQEGKMAAKPELASMIRFARVNLHHEPYPVIGRFDLIFCRNVLIYFDAPSKRRVIDRLLDRLDPSGFLFLGHSESLSQHEGVRAAGPTVYAQKECA